MWAEFDDSPVTHSVERERTIRIAGGRELRVTPVFDTYWRFATKRQQLFFARLAGPPPWTDDPVLATQRFTNAYRASDRVSQYLIRNVIYDDDRSAEETFFRVLLFKLFNKIETWERLLAAHGEVSWATFDMARYSRVLDLLMDRGECVYSAAYIMPPPNLGGHRKHENHLRLIVHMMKDGAPQRIADDHSLEEVFQLLKGYPSLGNFLAFQLAIDLNYTSIVNFPEKDFVVAGPGACDGIRKCFSDTAGLTERELIGVVADIAEEEFNRLGLEFPDLWGRKLQLIDFQNLFCEVDKYARVLHPNVKGRSGRSRIKQRFVAAASPLPQFYPPKWQLEVPPQFVALPLKGTERAN